MVVLGPEYRAPHEPARFDNGSSDGAMQMLRRGKLRSLERKIEHDKLRSVLRGLVDRPWTRPMDVAEATAALAAFDLSIDTPRVLPMDDRQILDSPDMAGYARSGDNAIVIALNACAHRIAETTAHECRHRMQMVSGKFPELYGKDLHERDARLFTVEFMSKYLTDHACPCR
jgi:hypothetical protein